MKFTSSVLLALMALSLAACQSGPDQRYLNASLGDNLELPPDLAEFEAESSFELPEVFSGDDPLVRNKVPVLARVESVKLSGSGDLYWLSVQEPVENLYQLIKNFWAVEGYRLVVDEPVIGVMQTEWVLKEEGAAKEKQSWLERLFAADDLSASQDQFRVRIERGSNGDANRVYLSHRGTEYKYVLDSRARSRNSDTENENDWHFRQSEPELEVEMLSRIMIYLGLQQTEVDQQVAAVKLFSPRASMHIDADEKSPFMVMKDSYQIAWNRVYHELERMNFEIASAEFKSGFSGEGVIAINAQVTESVADGGGFSFFSSGVETTEKKIFVVLSEETHEYTRVIIENEKGEFDTSPEGSEFLDLLYQNIK